MEQKLITLQRSKNKQNRCTGKSAPTPEYLPCSGEVSTKTQSWHQVTFPRRLLGSQRWHLRDQAEVGRGFLRRHEFPQWRLNQNTPVLPQRLPSCEYQETRVQNLAARDQMSPWETPKSLSIVSSHATSQRWYLLHRDVVGVAEKIQGRTHMQNLGYHRGRDLSTVVCSGPFLRDTSEDMWCAVTSFSQEGKPYENSGFIVWER